MIKGRVYLLSKLTLMGLGCLPRNFPEVTQGSGGAGKIDLANNEAGAVRQPPGEFILYMSNSKIRLWLVFTLFSLFLLAEHFVHFGMPIGKLA